MKYQVIVTGIIKKNGEVATFGTELTKDELTAHPTELLEGGYIKEVKDSEGSEAPEGGKNKNKNKAKAADDSVKDTVAGAGDSSDKKDELKVDEAKNDEGGSADTVDTKNDADSLLNAAKGK